MSAVVPACFEPRCCDGTDAGSRFPPPVPPACTEAMMHDPCRCDVVARPAPGVLWWGKMAPVCDPRVSAAGSAVPTCRALSPHASGNPASSWEDASRPCVPLYTARNTHTCNDGPSSTWKRPHDTIDRCHPCTQRHALRSRAGFFFVGVCMMCSNSGPTPLRYDPNCGKTVGGETTRVTPSDRVTPLHVFDCSGIISLRRFANRPTRVSHASLSRHSHLAHK